MLNAGRAAARHWASRPGGGSTTSRFRSRSRRVERGQRRGRALPTSSGGWRRLSRSTQAASAARVRARAAFGCAALAAVGGSAGSCGRHARRRRPAPSRSPRGPGRPVSAEACMPSLALEALARDGVPDVVCDSVSSATAGPRSRAPRARSAATGDLATFRACAPNATPSWPARRHPARRAHGALVRDAPRQRLARSSGPGPGAPTAAGSSSAAAVMSPMTSRCSPIPGRGARCALPRGRRAGA